MPTAYAQTPSGALPQLAPGQSLCLVFGIPTVSNRRDVGSYRTREGATVKCGIAYRSSSFNPMNAEAIKKLELLALKKAAFGIQ